MADVDKKFFINSLYQSAIYTGLVIGYNEVLRKVMSYKSPEIKLQGNDMIKVLGLITAADLTFDYLVKSAIIPANIMA